MRVLAIGCTGFLGSLLLPALKNRGHALSVVTRGPPPSGRVPQDSIFWNSPWETTLGDYDAIINLVGAPIASLRWTSRRKREIRNSRIDTALRIRDGLLRTHGRKPHIWINASAVGIYGDGKDRVLDESAPAGTDFLARVCQEWEAAASLPQTSDLRLVHLRTGIVLGNGGFLKAQLPLFKLGLGGRIGDGTQFVPWIHFQDWIDATLHLLETPVQGPAFNLVSPMPTTQAEFASILGETLGTWIQLPAPASPIRWLMGDAASLILNSQNARPTALLAGGFRFRYTTLSEALLNLFRDRLIRSASSNKQS